MSVDALLQHELRRLHARQRAVEPRVLPQLLVDVTVRRGQARLTGLNCNTTCNVSTHNSSQADFFHELNSSAVGD